MDCVRVEAVPPTLTDAAYFAMLLFVESPYVKRQLGRYQICILILYVYQCKPCMCPAIRILGKPFGVCLIYQVILWIPWHKQHRPQCPPYVVVLSQELGTNWFAFLRKLHLSQNPSGCWCSQILSKYFNAQHIFMDLTKKYFTKTELVFLVLQVGVTS